MVGGFMAGVALGQQLVGMNRKKSQVSTRAQRLQSAKMAAYRRMQARKKAALVAATKSQPSAAVLAANSSAEVIVFEEGFAKEFKNTFKDDASGQLLNSIRKTFSEFNAWVKKQTGGLLDLNMSLAIFFIIRGIRRIILERQYPNAWQMIWWASSILRGWRFV